MKLAYRLTFITCALLFVLDASAQSKKVALVGITAGVADFGRSEKITGMFYHVQPGFGFFVHEYVALGFLVNYSSFGYNDYPYTAFGLGPFMRIMTNNAFIQAVFDFGLVTDEIFPYTKITVGAGYAIHLSKTFAVEPQLFYAGHNESGKSFDFGGLGVGLGLQFYLYKYE